MATRTVIYLSKLFFHGPTMRFGKYSGLFVCSAAVVFLACITATCVAADLDQTTAERHINAGEFGLAMQSAKPNSQGSFSQKPSSLGQPRDQILAQIATAQSASGDSVAAGNTLRGISSPNARESAINGARGGGAFADFDSRWRDRRPHSHHLV